MTVRHLIFHCWPRRDNLDLLRWHADRLRKHIGIFTGRRLLAFAMDETTLTPDECRDLFGQGYDFSFFANDSERSESVSLRYQLGQLRDCGGVVFRAHAKGASYPPGHERHNMSKVWTEAMYLSCLNQIHAVDAALHSSPVAGPCRIPRLAEEWLGDAPWHFTGAFYWFRLDRLRAFWHDIWQHPRVDNYYFVEILPSLLCPQVKDSVCLHWDNCGFMYSDQASNRCLAAIKPYSENV